MLPVIARLQGVSGPVKGHSFLLNCETTNSIGRDPSNTIPILDSALSRQHCIFEWRASRWILRDLGSRNHTLHNGVLVMETELSDGDQVQVGGSLFVFSFPDEGPSAQTPTADTGDDLLANQTVVLRPSDSIYLRTPQDGKKAE